MGQGSAREGPVALTHWHSPSLSHSQVCILSDVPVSPRLPFFYCELQLQSMGQDGNFNVSVGLVPTSLKGANRGQQLMPGQIPRCAGGSERGRGLPHCSPLHPCAVRSPSAAAPPLRSYGLDIRSGMMMPVPPRDMAVLEETAASRMLEEMVRAPRAPPPAPRLARGVRGSGQVQGLPAHAR